MTEGTTLETIQKVYEDQLEIINRNTDERCRFRIQTLNKRLRRFGFESLICGMGSYSVQGPDVIFDDGHEQYPRSAQDVIYWAENQEGDAPKDLTDTEREALEEFAELCDWWVETTGGNDVTFDTEE